MIEKLNKQIRNLWSSKARTTTAKNAVKTVLNAEGDRLQDFVSRCSAAETAHLKARAALTQAGLQLRQAETKHGAYSLIAHLARQDSVKAKRDFGEAAAELYVAKTLA